MFPSVDVVQLSGSPLWVVLLSVGKVLKHHLIMTLKQNILSITVRFLHCVSDCGTES